MKKIILELFDGNKKVFAKHWQQLDSTYMYELVYVGYQSSDDSWLQRLINEPDCVWTKKEILDEIKIYLTDNSKSLIINEKEVTLENFETFEHDFIKGNTPEIAPLKEFLEFYEVKGEDYIKLDDPDSFWTENHAYEGLVKDLSEDLLNHLTLEFMVEEDYVVGILS